MGLGRVGAIAGWLGVGSLACAGNESSAPPGSAPPALSCLQKVQEAGALRRGEVESPQDGLKTAVLTILGHDLVAELARTGKERNTGLMLRDALATDSGMLFVYPDDRPRSFWMRNTCLPLTIAYIDSAGLIVALADMHPLDETPVPSRVPARYALEMTQGWFARKSISVGDRVVGLPPRVR